MEYLGLIRGIVAGSWAHVITGISAGVPQAKLAQIGSIKSRSVQSKRNRQYFVTSAPFTSIALVLNFVKRLVTTSWCSMVLLQLLSYTS